MADERIPTLTEAPVTRTGYNFIMDKTGNARAYRLDYTTFMAELTALYSPVVTTPTLTSATGTLTTTLCKLVTYGKMVSIQIIGSITIAAPVASIVLVVDALSGGAGTSGQQIYCNISDIHCVCESTAYSTLKLTITQETGSNFSAGGYSINVSGTLITT